jgi:transcriptional regulator with XRE-family HTH domain
LANQWGQAQGRNVRRLRSLRKWTQHELVEKTHVSLETVRGWENGSHKPTLRNLDELSKVFGVPIEQLWEEVVILVPELDVGVHFFPAPPVTGREPLVIEPIMRKLRAQDFDRYLIHGFHDLRAELRSRFQPNSEVRDDRSFLLDWARAKTRGLVLCGFRPRAEEDWTSFIDIIGWLKYDCCIVVIQAIDPFHVQQLFNAGSQYAAKPHDVHMTIQDYEPRLEDLRSEMPPCCWAAMLAFFDGRLHAGHRDHVTKLIDSKVLARDEDELVLSYGSEASWLEVATR